VNRFCQTFKMYTIDLEKLKNLFQKRLCSKLVVQSPSYVWLSTAPGTIARQLLCPWNLPGKNTRAGCHFLFQGIFPTQGLNLASAASVGRSFTTSASWEAHQPSLVTQTVKNPPARQETQVQFLDSLKKRMATHSSILVWRFPWTEKPGELQFMGSQRVEHDWATNMFKT